MAKNVGILAMDIYFPPTCVQQVTKLQAFFFLFSLFIIGAIAFDTLFLSEHLSVLCTVLILHF
ncbi:putative hydroxymethylglutaryl-CoA synthase [Arabidopsis thaliana]|jgi:hypothetical protein